jgi:hypothetical protein
MPTQKLTNEIISAAIQGFEGQKKQIDVQIAELRAMLSGGTAETAATPEPTPLKRKKFSAATRRKMAAAQKARYSRQRGESARALEPPSPEASKAKRKISAEGMKNIIAATKKRWRLQKAAKAQSAPAKKA